MNLFCNPRFLTDIHTVSDAACTIVSTGGSTSPTESSTLPGFGDVWFSNQAIANVLSMADIQKVFRVTQDSTLYDGIRVHLHSGRYLSFQERGSGLYYYDATPNSSNNKSLVYCFLSTVEERLQKLTLRQRKGVERAKLLYDNTGRLAPGKFRALVSD